MPSTSRDDGCREDPDCLRLFAALGRDPATLDELVERSGLAAAVLSSMPLMLELAGRVAGLPGNRDQWSARVGQRPGTRIATRFHAFRLDSLPAGVVSLDI